MSCVGLRLLDVSFWNGHIVSCRTLIMSYISYPVLITWFVASWRHWRLANQPRLITGKSGNWINVALAAEESGVSLHPIGRDKLFEVCNERRCCHRYGRVCDKARHSPSYRRILFLHRRTDEIQAHRSYRRYLIWTLLVKAPVVGIRGRSRWCKTLIPDLAFYRATVCNAVHGIARAFLSVHLSVYQTGGLWQNKRNLCPHSYTTWKITNPSFQTRRIIVGSDPFSVSINH